jgi:hypothetical protein
MTVASGTTRQVPQDVRREKEDAPTDPTIAALDRHLGIEARGGSTIGQGAIWARSGHAIEQKTRFAEPAPVVEVAIGTGVVVNLVDQDDMRVHTLDDLGDLPCPRIVRRHQIGHQMAFGPAVQRLIEGAMPTSAALAGTAPHCSLS